MLQMIFRSRGTGGKVLEPLLPRDEKGVAIVPDGSGFLSLAQASTLTGMSEAELREIWTGHWSSILSSEELAEVLKPPAAPPAMEAAEAQACDASAARRRWQGKFDVLRVSKYAHFSDEHFAEFLARCDEYGLNPLCEQICAELHHDKESGLPVVRMIVQLAGLRDFAASTGEYGGNDACAFEYGEDQRIPTKAYYTVYRLTQGQRVPFTGQALWDEHYANQQGENEVVDEKPHACLESRAEAAALRKAFPKLGGLYIPGEVSRSTSMAAARDEAQRPGRSRQPMPTPESLVDDYSPKTFTSLTRELLELGFNRAEKREMLLQQFEAKYPRLRQRNEPAFYAVLLHTVKENPAAYGAEVEPVLA